MKPPDPRRSLGFLVNELAQLFRADFNRRVEQLGLNHTQWRTLAQLARHQGINQSQLAAIMEIRPISLTRQLDVLQEADWVERRPDPADRRALCLHLTRKAERLLSDAWAQAAASREGAMKGLSAAQREALLDMLFAMRANLVAARSAKGRR
jgi:DNA-binding MarR family transcriptional regulator